MKERTLKTVDGESVDCKIVKWSCDAREGALHGLTLFDDGIIRSGVASRGQAIRVSCISIQLWPKVDVPVHGPKLN